MNTTSPLEPCGNRFFLDKAMPEEVKVMVRPLIEQYETVVPPWCRQVSVFWKDSDGEAALGVEAFYDYRRATLWIYPNFVSRPDKRESNFVHELMHLLTEPLWNAVQDVKAFLKEHHAESAELINEQMRHALEQSTCDMTTAFLER